MENFAMLGLSADLNDALARMDYTTPTPIQAQSIPLALSGHDILGSAQTGTGKTAAFSIPLVESLLRDPQASALVLTPTRELAKQVLDVIKKLVGPKSAIKTAFIIGGESIDKQFAQLRAKPRIVVGTPGRVNDHLKRGTLKLNNTGFLVLDETDRMLDMGFGVQLDEIWKYLPEKRQTLMFSATLPKAIIKLSSKYLSNPERVSVGDTNVVAQNLTQDIAYLDQAHKYPELLKQLNVRSGSVIVFVKTKHAADKMAINLGRDGFEADALHGDLQQRKRDRVMRNFRQQNFRILVATDIAARGLDVPHIEHVVNFDLPQVAEDYIHRLGRTARAGASGSALCFIAPHDREKWRAIERLLNPDASFDDATERGFPRRGKGNGAKKGPAKKFGARSSGKSFDKPFEKKRSYANDSNEERRSKDANTKWGDKPQRTRSREDSASPYADKRPAKPFKKEGFARPERSEKPYNSETSDRADRGARSDFAGQYGNRKPAAKKRFDDRPAQGNGYARKANGQATGASSAERGAGKPARNSAGKPTGKPSGKPAAGKSFAKPYSKTSGKPGGAKPMGRTGAGAKSTAQSRRPKSPR